MKERVDFEDPNYWSLQGYNDVEFNVLEIDSDPLEEGEDISDSNERFARTIQDLPISVGEKLVISIYSKRVGWSIDVQVIRNTHIAYSFVYYARVGGEIAPTVSRYLIGDRDITTGWYSDKPQGMADMEMLTFIQDKIVFFYMEVEERGKYPFLVQSRSDLKKKRRKSKGKFDDKVKIVYLGKPPTINKRAKSKETGEVKFGYDRVEHRRTLRHSRFKNHPKYNVYKGVKVSGCWCGPKEFKSPKKIYRLWEPHSDDVLIQKPKGESHV